MMTPLYKLLIHWYQASDKELPAWLERACQGDQRLRREKAAGDELTGALRRRPRSDPHPQEETMTARVLTQIAEEDYRAGQEAASAPAWAAWTRAAGMAVAALAVALVGYQYLNTDPEVAAEAAPATVAERGPATAPLIELPRDWKTPLDQEIEYIVSDAKGALGFLANSFVPSSYLEDEDNA